jgi:N-acetylneuraminic acid mutarotase
VLTQPASENCTVTNGSGTVSTDVDASIVCVGEWSWMGGSSAVGFNDGQSGVYGTLGAASPTNLPGGREQAATWKDAAGNTWVFGGNGTDSMGTIGQLNDMWKFNPTAGTSGEWTWMGGSAVASLRSGLFSLNGQPGVYGTLGVASPANIPGGREQAVTWTDASGNLWLFGGLGLDSVATDAYLNDLWEFNPNLGANGEWTWMGGSSIAPPVNPVIGPEGLPGVYGTLGMAAPANVPGARYGAYAWTDASGNLWLFGGQGFDSADSNGYLNDLWEYKPGANNTPGNWTWMGGVATLPPSPAPWIQSAEPGVYGTLGIPASGNIPGGRSAGMTWADASGNLWLFGGLGADSTGNTGYLNDLWKYTPGASGNAGEWTWMGGGNTIGNYGGQPGVYGALGVADSTNIPGARFSSATWVDPSGNLWLFGGQGYDWVGTTAGFLNDVWKYTPDADNGTGQWTWMGGSNVIPPSSGTSLGIMGGEPGVYGTLGTPASTNTPGGRIGAAPLTDASGNLWLFGGFGPDSTGLQGYLNDVWKYQP